MSGETSEGSGEWLALAVHPREERAALYRGPHEFSYPITFDGVLGDDLEVDSEIRRIWFETFGWHWVIAEAGTEEGDVVMQTVDALRNGVDLKQAFGRGLVEFAGGSCSHCGVELSAEGSDKPLGLTCPECGHPVNDPKVDNA